MARAQLNEKLPEPTDLDANSDWQALRSDLVNLLHQVEDRVGEETAPKKKPPTARPKNARKRAVVENREVQPRHHEALQTVTRTMARVSEREQDPVNSAIEQIRYRHTDIPRRRLGRVNDINNTVSTMADRLEQIGSDLRYAEPSPSSVEEIAIQLEQLTHVVELLAGAVGETGQVKRLEAQIAHVAELIAETQQGSSGDVSTRIENLVAQVSRLSDLQQQHADRPIAHLEELATNQENGLRSIETGVRNVYDRIDAIEQNLAASPELGRLGDEMAAITQEMANISQLVKANSGPSNTLLSRVDALNARIGQIEDRGDFAPIGGLQTDVETLRDSIRDMLEPRLEEITRQITSLGNVPPAEDGEAPNTSALESQIRQLLARMDQTGEQLSDIKQLYEKSAAPGGAEAPDLEALAELVANRTTEAISRNAQAPAKVALDTDGLDALEKRMAQLFSDNSTGQGTENSEEFAGVQASMKQVDARLAGLETTVQNSLTKAQSVQQATPSPAAVEPHPARPAVAKFSQPPAPAPRDDSMQVNPSDEQPLVDAGFGAAPSDRAEEPTPQPRDHPAARAEAPTSAAPAHDYNPNDAELPSKPRSSLAADPEPSFAAPLSVDRPAAPIGENPVAATPNAGRNTFIEAARRAAQRQEELEPAGSQSLIAKALARFQRDDADANSLPGSSEPDFKDDVRTARQQRADRKAEAKAAKQAAKAELHADRQAAPLGAHEHADEYEEAGGSFISRHRRTLLLALAVVAVSLLALNLVQSRLGSSDTAATAPASAETVAPSAGSDTLTSTPSALLDPASTGSVDTMVRMVRDTPLPITQDLPTTLLDSSAMPSDQFITGSLPEVSPTPMVSPLLPEALKVELPPETVGPLELRQAAANGDPRAQFEIAAIYSEGQATEQNLAEAAKWYERSAAQGFVPAEYRLGNLYEHGKGVLKDLMQAKLWYQRAAEAGNRMSMHNLAALYASGELGAQEFPLAAEWFERAAVRGLTDSQFNLGMLHARGLGVPQDMPESFKWFSLAAQQGDDGAQKARDDVARSLDAETVNRLQTEITNWQRTPIDIAANFAPIGTWTSDFNPGQTIDNKGVVEKVQAALNRLGYDVGVPDGLMGPRTSDAIKQFEKATGMSEIGAVNPRLLAVLGSQPV